MENIPLTNSKGCARAGTPVLVAVILLISLTYSAPSVKMAAGTSPVIAQQRMRATTAYAQLPLAFEENRGQADAATRFLAHGAGFSLALTPDALLLAPSSPHAIDQVATAPAPAPVRMGFVGANPTPEITSSNPLAGVVNYLIGNDPAHWRTNIPTAGQVRYHALSRH